MAEVAEDQPLLCLIDDAQWLDTASAQIVQFVGRRLLAERIALVGAARPQAGSEVLAGLPELPLAGLGAADARALLLDNLKAPFDAAVSEQIVSESHGNPLALLELPRTWNVADLAGGFGLPARHQVATKIEQSYATRLLGLPAETQLLVLVAAAEPLGDPLQAVPWFLDAAARLESIDLGLARDSYLQALQAASVGGRLVGDLLPRAAEAARRSPPPEGTPRATDLLVAGLAVRFSDGYAASADLLKRALRALRDEDQRDPRWPRFARRLVFDLFDEDACSTIITRSVELARERGALGVLPLALDFLAMLRSFEGNLEAAEAALQEAEAIGDATRAEPIGPGRLTLAGFRGDPAVLADLVREVEPRATARGDGVVLTLGEHARALVHNGAGRYEAALPHAERASARDELGVSGCGLCPSSSRRPSAVASAGGGGPVRAAQRAHPGGRDRMGARHGGARAGTDRVRTGG